MVDEPLTIWNFFPRLWHRFSFGNYPSPFNSLHQFNFSFDSHPGPIDDAIHDARSNSKSLFVFIYSCDNPLTNKIVNLLRLSQISQEISSNFVFYPVDVSWPEGWTLANSLLFTKIPLIALIRPRRNSLAESQIFVKHEGDISEATLLSYIHVEVNTDQQIIQQQNRDFEEALHHEENLETQNNNTSNSPQNLNNNENNHESNNDNNNENNNENTLNNLNSLSKEKIDEEFNNLPHVERNNGKNVRFIFPDGTPRTQSFPNDGTVHMFFVFVRKFLFPDNFILLAGFPQQEIVDSDEILSNAFSERQFIVYIQSN